LIAGAAEVLRSAPPILATVGDAVGASCFLVVDNLTAHLANPSWSTGELSHPPPSPPVAAPLVAVDDEPEPLDPFLILRLRLDLTGSAFKRH
jgi:hypothetical protein